MKKFADQQPKDGDCILHCGHINTNLNHFFKIQDGPTKFIRPDGTVGNSEWLVACDKCYKKAGEDIERV